ncbi:hypothetical protein L6452_41543 [Arctium lappa]|uniref:Uncharacterized protein n=1 Tax=Arctium lappa TaxID=4217 RepID=A0ACB8XNI3_ARCLA|nr:hypothetical protein L6452_41543 [Arctium lappa]
MEFTVILRSWLPQSFKFSYKSIGFSIPSSDSDSLQLVPPFSPLKSLRHFVEHLDGVHGFRTICDRSQCN